MSSEVAMKRICVFAGSSPGARQAYSIAARDLAKALAAKTLGLVYGGANVGLMYEIAQSARDANCEVIGIIPRSLVEKELAFRELSDLRVVESMHERKALMADLSDGFIALPGGLGTLEEFFEIVTWAQLGIHQKPCGLLNVEGYFDKLLAFLDYAVEERFIRGAHRQLVIVDENPDRLLERFEGHIAPKADKWLDQEER
jgi:uncharacterized protein (TIGR00730 family)